MGDGELLLVIGPPAVGKMTVGRAICDLPTRLERNVGEERILHKRSKRDLAWSDAHVRELEMHRMNTDPDVPSAADAVLAGHRHLRLDNSDLSADEVAARVLEWLGTREDGN
jgi:hypothetical protein